MNRNALLKEKLKETGLKYKKIAEITSIPEGTLYRYAGGRPIKDDRLLLICERLGFDPKIFGLEVRDFIQKEAI